MELIKKERNLDFYKISVELRNAFYKSLESNNVEENIISQIIEYILPQKCEKCSVIIIDDRRISSICVNCKKILCLQCVKSSYSNKFDTIPPVLQIGPRITRIEDLNERRGRTRLGYERTGRTRRRSIIDFNKCKECKNYLCYDCKDNRNFMDGYCKLCVKKVYYEICIYCHQSHKKTEVCMKKRYCMNCNKFIDTLTCERFYYLPQTDKFCSHSCSYSYRFENEEVSDLEF
jgi:hypothetical protein